MRDLESALAEWQHGGLISAEQADAVRVYEASAPPGKLDPEPASTSSLVSEVLGYLGAVLAFSAIAAILGQTWNDMGTVARIGVAAGLTVVFAVAGAALLRSVSAPSRRLCGVMLAAAVVSATWLVQVICDRLFDANDNQTWVATALTATASAAVAYALRRRGLAQVMLLLAASFLVAALVAEPGLDAQAMWVCLSVAALGAAWVVLATLGWLPPANVAQVSGGLTLLFGIYLAFQLEPSNGDWVWLLVVGVLVAVGMLSFATVGRGNVALMVPGALGLLVLVPQLIDVVFGESLVTWFAVLATGVALVGFAVWLVRSRRLKESAPGDGSLA